MQLQFNPLLYSFRTLLPLLILGAVVLASKDERGHSLAREPDVPAGPLIHDADNLNSPSILRSFVDPELRGTTFKKRDIFARRAPSHNNGHPELTGCSPGCWWNEDTKRCNCCPRGSSRCHGRRNCCPEDTYCTKFDNGDEGCCPMGRQCAPMDPGDAGAEYGRDGSLRRRSGMPPKCADPSFELCPDQDSCCPAGWICYKDSAMSKRCGCFSFTSGQVEKMGEILYKVQTLGLHT
ncbi:hypothetical protein P691DRAFT_496409 [Macrolepiota fuliginosa MF-IS2]|uniref:Granulins domain-containing protein n=1 Tax=Macrolepiota fuliginosa MF-IS2 TaxID=1400762 RepID=A0A9P5XI32_9AGAR|nr:hypothetical protein P691DRAFT_496409 [Macrolepiota fuliginosa MF-IS2]